MNNIEEFVKGYWNALKDLGAVITDWYQSLLPKYKTTTIVLAILIVYRVLF